MDFDNLFFKSIAFAVVSAGLVLSGAFIVKVYNETRMVHEYQRQSDAQERIANILDYLAHHVSRTKGKK